MHPNARYNIENSRLLELREKGMSFPKIGRELGIPRETIKYRMKLLGIKKSIPENNPFANCIYSYDRNFFEVVDNQEKAYILGLFYADGNNFSKGLTKYKSSLVLHKNDAKLLQEVNNLLSSNRPLQELQNTYILNINGKHFCDQLTKLGCVPAKSLILKFPTEEQVPYNLLHHFIRGYFDGDGCVSSNYKNSKGIRVTIVGTSEFLTEMQKILAKCGIISSIYKDRKSPVRHLKIFRKDSVESFYNLIYKDCSIKLDRKYEKFFNHFKS